MEDLILTSRLDSLEQNLTQIVDNSAWLRDCVLRPSMPQNPGEFREPWPEQVWDELDSTVGSEARNLKSELQKIRLILQKTGNKSSEDASLDLRDAWARYRQVYEDSQEVFGECLEYIGGLALRDRGFDQKICDIADSLIVSCATEWNNFKWESLTVLAAQDKLGQTLARIIRLRFPEWTVWTLPFAAHELGHVAIHSVDALKDFVETKVEELKEQHPQLEAMRKSEPAGSEGLNWAEKLDWAEKRARRHAEYHISELVADAFATYAMGPAYACAAILLRFNPLEGGSEGHDHPTDLKRAEMVIGTLEWMSKNATGVPPYRDIIDRLTREWKLAKERVASPPYYQSAQPEPRLEEKIDITKLIEETMSVFSTRVRPNARFDAKDADNGWLNAQSWHRNLMENMKKGMSALAGLKITRMSPLRDALNAAWLCRIYDESGDVKLNQKSDAALALCEEIIKARTKPKDGGVPPAASYGPAGMGGALPPAQEAFNKST